MFYLPDDEMQSDVLIQGVLRIYETKTGISGVVQTLFCYFSFCFVVHGNVIVWLD